MTAVVCPDTYELVVGVPGSVKATSRGRETTIVLPIADALRLRQACRDLPSTDPRYGREARDVRLGIDLAAPIEDE